MQHQASDEAHFGEVWRGGEFLFRASYHLAVFDTYKEIPLQRGSKGRKRMSEVRRGDISPLRGDFDLKDFLSAFSTRGVETVYTLKPDDGAPFGFSISGTPGHPPYQMEIK